MNLHTKTLAWSLALALSGACGGSGGAKSAPREDTPDAAVGMGESEPEAVPLALWVDDLIENHTTDSSQPDTVEDKVIEDTEDPREFDHYFD